MVSSLPRLTNCRGKSSLYSVLRLGSYKPLIQGGMRPMLVQPDELGSTSKEHDRAAALKTEIANTSHYRLRSHMDIWNFYVIFVC